MDNWDEVRTAFQVARMGTVSGAADVLGVHHATVIRHIDALEGKLGVKLFQRHARGYTATEAGEDLLLVAKATDDQFSQLEGRIKGSGDAVSGELVVTSLESMARLLAPIMTDFQAEYPEVIVRYLTGARLFRLEYGEAHVALRAGPKPQELDNVVQSLGRLRLGLFASPSYIERHGKPSGADDLAGHRFVGPDETRLRAPFLTWMKDNLKPEQIVFRTMDAIATEQAVIAGAGIGFLPLWVSHDHPELQEVMPALDEWSGELWLVTHVDLHRTTKVQAFVNFLKDRAAADWVCS
ncbi:transcriptional regulator, LysR family [Shimia gijangensis]|uniref:Transcriptional regulator, LysR family n=1 Tax=Shimia gijangensis TaxID=1470563 RepID=A0A1M6KF78_9RHOB|nr:LysR family transcriptional regulator [Shimia gijangensis]SHJ57538.1 transcriptional regulator, LysR family [Shimia gijangensis]